MATVYRSMTDTDPATDPGGADVDGSGSAGSERGATGDGAGTERGTPGRNDTAVDADGRATPRLADAPDADREDRSVDGPGGLPEPEPIEPETPRVESAVFVLLGALGTIALLATVIVPGLL